jgi:Flp pilus assembly protein TadB
VGVLAIVACVAIGIMTFGFGLLSLAPVAIALAIAGVLGLVAVAVSIRWLIIAAKQNAASREGQVQGKGEESPSSEGSTEEISTEEEERKAYSMPSQNCPESTGTDLGAVEVITAMGVLVVVACAAFAAIALALGLLSLPVVLFVAIPVALLGIVVAAVGAVWIRHVSEQRTEEKKKTYGAD